ncbi:hypothetical protein ACHHYP_14200 [Achlya hypogyna]|uniref:E3 ubiquitin-protein ligase n=1 Tax=Achlya hypogyna TaxID=1202772 RepID=A0A1V9YDT6_ACHHY|nr:hypothetical protein ACHHYP_14200 [Achlya hypogyna]
MTTKTVCLATPGALAAHVENALSSSAVEVLPHGWLQSFLEDGHTPASVVAYLEAALLAAVRASGASQETVAEYLTHVHQQHALSAPRRVCGYMFKHNDIAWNCRDCQMDDTCVQCQACFQASDHTGHQVFFHRTSPGGMCDCGDEEAWKPSGFCPKHLGNSAGEDPTATLLLPDPVRRVVDSIMAEVIGFLTVVAHRSAESFDDERVAAYADAARQAHLVKYPTDLRPKLFHVRVSNDDVHTDEELIVSLQKKGFTAVFAQTFTHSVDRKGSGLLRRHETFADAVALMRVMQAENWFVSIVDDAHMAREDLAEHTLSYVAGLASLAPAVQAPLFDALFAPVAAPTYAAEARDPMRVLLHATPFLKKPLVRLLAQIYLKLMGERERKAQFARAYAKVYSRLALQYFCGVGTNKEALFGLGVQMFTTPSIVHALVHDEGFLDTILLSLQSGFDLAKAAHGIDVDQMVVRYRRYQPLVMDLNHILVLPHMAAALCADETLATYVDILKDLDSLNPQRRVPESRPHVDVENDRAWIGAFNLHLTLASIPPALFKGLRQEPARLAALLPRLRDAAWRQLPQWTPATTHSEVVQFAVHDEAVSFHHPLYHLLSRIVLEHLALATTPLAAFVDAADTAAVDAMLEPPLRTLVWASQIASNLWVRNGADLMVRQLTSYYNIGYNLSFRDLDLTLVQAAATLMGPQRFMAAFLARYDVDGGWLSSDKRLLYVADCLLKLAWIITELPPPPTQPVEVSLRREVVHFLSYQSFLYSALREQTEPLYARPGLEGVSDDTKNKQLMAVLHDVADCTVGATEMTPAKFALKPALFAEYDPTYVHLSPVNHVKAQVARQDALYKTWQPTAPPLPTVARLPAGHPALQPCRDLALAPATFGLVRRCLQDAALHNDETVLSRLVHLVTVQLLVLGGASPAGVWDELRHASSAEQAAKRHKAVDEETAVGAESILGVLAAKAVGLRAALEESTKPLLSALLFVLDTVRQTFPASAAYLVTHVFPPETTAATPPMDAKARLVLQKQKQAQAMAAMLQRQSQFAGMLADDDDSDADDDTDTAAQTVAQPAPECIICAQVKKDEPVMFIALAQPVSSVRSHRFDPIAPTIHTQLCGHALHLPCATEYLATVAREAGLSLLLQHAVAFDASVGEFLCPLCKSLSNALVPFVPRPAAAPTSLEGYFQGAASCERIADFCITGLPALLTAAPPMDTAPSAYEGMAAFLHSLRSLRPINLANPVSIVHVVVDAVAQAFDAAELRGFSAALAEVAYGDAAAPLAHRLGVGMPAAAEACLDPFTPRDDAKLHAMLLLLSRLPVMMPAATFKAVVPEAIARALTATTETPTDAEFAATVATGLLPTLGLPLLGQDLFATLLLVCSVLRDKAHMLWAIRAFASLHMVQVLLQCLQPVDDLVDDATPAEATPVEAWRAQVAAALGVDVPPTAPTGSLLQLTFETTILAFLRKATLLARAVFRGPDDPDAALYLNFVAHIQLSTQLPAMCAQLGVPLPGDLLASPAFQAIVAKYLAPFPNVLAPHVWKQPTVAPPADGTLATLDGLPRLPLQRHGGALWAAHVAVTRLAARYTDFYAAHGQHMCPTTQQPQESTAICMRCGVAVCAGTDCCKRNGRGACFQHVEHCGHGNGAFFLLKACSMLLVSVHGRACFFASPYVDEFGEEDLYVKRGRPLQLRPKRLLAVVQHLAGHTVAAEVSKVRRTSEQYIRSYYY